MTGVLILDKPAGFTSFDAVAVCRRLCHERENRPYWYAGPYGHRCAAPSVGKATRAASLLEDTDKEYEAGFRLGVSTDTEDSTGKVLETSDTPVSRGIAGKPSASFSRGNHAGAAHVFGGFQRRKAAV